MRSDQPGENLGRNLRAQSRVALQKASDVGQVLLPLAGAPGIVRHGPDLSLEHILQARHRQPQAQHIPYLGPVHEGRVAGIGLNLNAESGPWHRHVQAVGEPLHAERLAQERLDLAELVGGNRHVQVQAHHRLGVRVYRLPAHHAIPDAVVGQERDQPVEKIDPVFYHCFPEGLRAHRMIIAQ